MHRCPRDRPCSRSCHDLKLSTSGTESVGTRSDFEAYTGFLYLNIFKTKYTGKGGTDTGNRLSNTTEWEEVSTKEEHEMQVKQSRLEFRSLNMARVPS